MNFKALITALVLAGTSTAALAQPIVRDHRGDTTQVVRDHREQPTATYQTKVKTTARPSWMASVNANVNYGFQVDRDGDEAQGYRYGQDPIVEGVRRDQWSTLAGGLKLAYNQQSQVNVDLDGQRLSSIELQATGGRNWISEVHVQLNDGREIKLTTSRFVDVVHSPNMRLDLGAQAKCGIRKIEIFGYSSGKGSFNVIGA